MKKVMIRQARASDAKTLASIGHAAWKRGIATALSPETQDRVCPSAFEDFASRQPDNILLAETEGRVLGFAAAEDGENNVTDLWVNAEDEGHGIGTRLLLEMEHQIANRGHATVHLEIMTSNTRTLGLTQNRGYHIVGQGMRMDRILALPLHKTELSKRLIGA